MRILPLPLFPPIHPARLRRKVEQMYSGRLLGRIGNSRPDSPRRPTMLTRIVRNSPQLCGFLDLLPVELSKPQRQHVLNLADGLLVCEDTKTLAALQRQFLDAPDASNMADFLRQSPWSVTDLRDRLRDDQVAWAIEHAQRNGLPKVLYLNI